MFPFIIGVMVGLFIGFFIAIMLIAGDDD